MLKQVLDKDGDKFLSREELRVFVEQAERKSAEKESANIMEEHDINNDHELSESEFEEYVSAEDRKRNMAVSKEMFKLADIDKSGSLSVKELASLIRPPHESELERLETSSSFTEIDTNNDGKVSISEYYENDTEITEEDKKHFRNEIDKNGDGFMSLNEYKNLQSEEDKHQVNAWVDHILELADKNKDGKINQEEFDSNKETFDSLFEISHGDDQHEFLDEL